MARGCEVARPAGAGPALVTGGAGFIGSALVRALAAAGRPVHVLDDLSRGRRDRLPEDVPLHVADVRDAGAVTAAAREVGAEVIFHLAAQIDVRHAVEQPADDAAVNILGMVNVLEAARAGGARVVFASSGGAAYGEPPGIVVPTPESATPAPMSPYGLSKVCAEGYCLLYTRLHGVPTTVLRLSNVYGPGQDHMGEAGVIAIFCGCAVDGRPPTVFGDGGQTRDYVYVDDVVAAFVAGESAPAGSVLNVGTGVESTVLELLDALPGLPPARFAPERAGEVQRSALDASLAGEVLGWRARMPLREGLRRTLEAVRAAGVA